MQCREVHKQLHANGEAEITRRHKVLLSLGASQAGTWGIPTATLTKAIHEFAHLKFRDGSVTFVYLTTPVSATSKSLFHNLVVQTYVSETPRELLRSLKKLEWAAGRRPGPRWSDRPLDIDIISYDRLILNWGAPNSVRPRLTLPHPRAHMRRFVLQPIADSFPEWRHPVFQLTAEQLLRRLPPSSAGPEKVVKQRPLV